MTTFCQAATAAGVAVDLRVVSGHPLAAILDHAASLPADLIVIGTHGVSGFQHLVLGSVTEKVLRRATCPVLTVPPPAQATSTLPFKRLLCAVDFSEPSLEAVRFAGSLAREAGARLVLMHVLEWPWHEPPPPRLVRSAPGAGRRARRVQAPRRNHRNRQTRVGRIERRAARYGGGRARRPRQTVRAAPGRGPRGRSGPDRPGCARQERAGPGRLRVDDESVGASGHVPGADSPQLTRRAASGRRYGQLLDVEIRLVEPVEQHKAVRSGPLRSAPPCVPERCSSTTASRRSESGPPALRLRPHRSSGCSIVHVALGKTRTSVRVALFTLLKGGRRQH